ncbi:hypothetical protein LTR56_012879 [Elasticomyces elasticus]|nr:hypothetical protein LTR56_012879 [Elasticomyces elasticus]KAK3650805.1 hypothetical protein LTR22_012404 [Elasticomyces elasticus]KAK4918509.1 hypothetical protein LTR49_013742 [Elasticomyces elasticus]KAK5757853.1 hypothetical protein LTS12_012037 [Elasticomyces elasticus]
MADPNSRFDNADVARIDATTHRNAFQIFGDELPETLQTNAFAIAAFRDHLTNLQRAQIIPTGPIDPPMLGSDHDDEMEYQNAMRRYESRMTRRWNGIIYRRSPNAWTISPLFIFPHGAPGRVLLSNGTNGFGWVTEVSRRFRRGAVADESNRRLLTSFLTNHDLIRHVETRTSALQPNSEVTRPRAFVANYPRTFQMQLERFRRGLREMGGYCWMIEERRQVDLTVAVIDGPFFIVAWQGREAIIPLPERYDARSEPIVIEDGLLWADSDS